MTFFEQDEILSKESLRCEYVKHFLTENYCIELDV